MTLSPDTPLVDSLLPSPNIEPRRDGKRPAILLLHYTGLPTLARSLEVLASPECKVSCHYVVAEDGTVIQMVPEAMRAWHAGVAYWAGETDINSLSIGIEIQNPGHAAGYPDFPGQQMRAVEALAGDICTRHAIAADRVLAHSDVAPDRKCDPGEKFDWASLSRSGTGLWVAPAPLTPAEAATPAGEAQQLLAAYGYPVPKTGTFDLATTQVIRAFQRHFRQQRCDGVFDASTQETLMRLLDARGLWKA